MRKMKSKFKLTFATSLLTVGLFAVTFVEYGIGQTGSAVEPDMAVYTALKGLGFNETSPTSLPENITSDNATSYLDALKAAQKFFAKSVAENGTPTPPDTGTTLLTYYNKVGEWKAAVEGFQTRAAAIATAKIALGTAAALNQTSPAVLKSAITSIAPQFSALTGDANLAKVYENIRAAYRNITNQTSTDSLATYLNDLKELSTTINSNSQMFNNQTDITRCASIVTNNVENAKKVSAILTATMTTPTNITSALTSQENLTAIRAWRQIKNAVPQLQAQ
jgi:hypothetical protein